MEGKDSPVSSWRARYAIFSKSLSESGGIGEVEVFWKLNPHEERGPYGNMAVCGEVKIDLISKEKAGGECVNR